MPQVTVYIRERDLEKWKSIDKKSEFIHNALNAQGFYEGAKTAEGAIKKVKALGQVPDEWEGPLLRDKKKGKL